MLFLLVCQSIFLPLHEGVVGVFLVFRTDVSSNQHRGRYWYFC